MVLNKNKDELVSPPHSYHSSFRGGPSSLVQSILFLLVIPISLCSFLTFYGVKSDDDCAPFHCRGRGVLLHMQLEILLVGLVKFVSVN